MLLIKLFVFALFVFESYSLDDKACTGCKRPRYQLRRDGGHCFEVPPWQHLPVQLEGHINYMKEKFGNSSSSRRQIQVPHLALVNSELSRYMDTVLAPFLDTYLNNIQSSYQLMTSKIAKRIKDEISTAVQKKNHLYRELVELAEQLRVPAMCDEERREAKTQASRHVAMIYACAEEARASIAKMGEYAAAMISITKNHMQTAMQDAAKSLEVNFQRIKNMKQDEVTLCLQELSRAAVSLGYELDLSLTNARRHSEQSHEKLSYCCTQAKRTTDDDVNGLKNLLNQCVYA